MSLYNKYLVEIDERKKIGLDPKPIDDANLLQEIIDQIKDPYHNHRADSLKFLIYNVLPGTTPAAKVKSSFLKEIILRKNKIDEYQLLLLLSFYLI